MQPNLRGGIFASALLFPPAFSVQAARVELARAVRQTVDFRPAPGAPDLDDLTGGILAAPSGDVTLPPINSELPASAADLPASPEAVALLARGEALREARRPNLGDPGPSERPPALPGGQPGVARWIGPDDEIFSAQGNGSHAEAWGQAFGRPEKLKGALLSLLQARPEEGGRDVWDGLAARMLESPTARELAAELVELGQPVRVMLEPTGGTSGLVRVKSRPIEVVVDPGEIEADPTLAQAAGTFAHELLGHVLRNLQADLARLGRAYDYSMEDELNALFAGWVVEAELGRPIDNSLLKAFLSDPGGLPETIALLGSFESGLLMRRQMLDPVPAYESRLAQIPPKAEGKLGQVRERLDWRIWYLKSRRGRSALRSLQHAAESPFLRAMEEEVARLAARLRRLLGAPE